VETLPFLDGGIQTALLRVEGNLDGGVSSLRQINETPVAGDVEIPFEDLLNFQVPFIQVRKLSTNVEDLRIAGNILRPT